LSLQTPVVTELITVVTGVGAGGGGGGGVTTTVVLLHRPQVLRQLVDIHAPQPEVPQW
jgi:hypothetical protein